MHLSVVDLTCPGCGAPVASDISVCKYCGRPVLITSFSTARAMPNNEVAKSIKQYQEVLCDHPETPTIEKALGVCYVVRGNYDRAVDSFEHAIDNDPDDPENYYFAAIALLKGKKPFLAKRKDIDKILEYLNTAIDLAESYDDSHLGLYYYLLSYVSFDYFSRKSLNVYPTFAECLENAKLMGATRYDVQDLHSVLKTQKPVELE